MSRSRHSTPRNATLKRPDRGHGPRGLIVLDEAAGHRVDRLFGGPMPDGPLPGRLLVLLSRLHRAESSCPVQKATAPER